MQKQYKEINHPLLKHKLGLLRDKNTSSSGFREMSKEISRILAYEAMREWTQMETIDVETPITKTKVERLKSAPIVVSIMRAGNIMMDGVLDMIPVAKAGHIGIYRDKFIKNTVEYYFKLPENSKGQAIFLCDPLIATADTMIAALDRLRNYEVGEITVLSILVSPMALEKIAHFHPDVKMIYLSKEEGLTDKGYLIPGVGDAGDRLFNTK